MNQKLIKRMVIFFLCSFFIMQAQDTNSKKAAEITENLYGSDSVNVSFDQLNKIKKLLNDLFSASPYQLQLAAHFLLPKLKDLYDDTEKEIDRYKKENKQVPENFFYKKFILKEQIDHLNNILKSDITLLQKVQGILHRMNETIVKYGKNFFGYDFEPITAQNLAQEIFEYIEFERENILYNAKKLIIFLHARKKNQLPKIIDFWDTFEVQEKLHKRARQMSPEVEVQFAGFLVSFALQGLVMAGGELALEQYKEEYQKRILAYQKKQQAISKSWETFQKGLAQEQKDILSNIIKVFKKQQKKLQDEYKTSNLRLSEALIYLNQSINLDTPIKRYLEGAINWDQYFASSPMYTPKNHAWYNIFNVFTKGDWEFDSSTNSFWQNAITTMPEKLYWKEKKQNIFTQDPSIYSIFTEYIPQTLNYDIEIECTLVNCNYPFFAGIMFNRGRWISGDPERIWWYRLLGLYGTQQNENNKTTRAINLSFAQQILDIPKGDKTKEKITSPLEQIITNKTKPLNYALNVKEVSLLEANPITFIFKITNKSDTVLLELDKKINGSVQKLYSGSVQNLDPYIYLFHGIGFMAVGCQAQFKIIKPTALVYENNELKTFENEMKKLK